MAKHIDWRRQFNRLKPYLDGKGGFINIRYNGSSCGVNAFLLIFQSEFENRSQAKNPRGAFIMLAPENYRVRYLAGIRSEFSRVLSDPLLAKCDKTIFPFDVSVLCNNTAGGDQHIEANFDLTNDHYMVIERNEWVSSLIHALREYLKTNRLAIIMLSGPSSEQSEFWSSIGSQAKELTQEGLLLVRMINEKVDLNRSDFDMYEHIYEHDCEFTLPSELDGENINYAIDDIAALISNRIPKQDSNCDKNIAYAKAYVLLNKDNVSNLHNRLYSFISDLEEYKK